MIVYAIRHKRTGEYMPLMHRNKGYSHWNPDRPEVKVNQVTKVIRLVESEAHAKNIIKAWFCMPNAHQTYIQSYDGDYFDDMEFKEDGRQKEDLEIVAFKLVEI